MRFLITGELGFIGRNLFPAMERAGHEGFRLNDGTEETFERVDEVVGEDWFVDQGFATVPCVHKNSPRTWQEMIQEFEIDVVIHNAAVVGTDVVALDSKRSTLTNVLGTYNVCQGAEQAGVPVCYLGTTVIYDTELYQNELIYENSLKKPRTLYGQQKLAAEHIVRGTCSKWNIIRPLFAYGGVGDMNSLIAKSFFAHMTDREPLDMFLNPDKIKDYLHVDDFCDAVVMACDQGLWNDDFNVAAETPHTTSSIVKMLDEMTNNDVSRRIAWHPETDYLGNHRLSSQKFRLASGWLPKISLMDGMARSLKSIRESLDNKDGYDPMRFLDEADQKGVDLTKFY